MPTLLLHHPSPPQQKKKKKKNSYHHAHLFLFLISTFLYRRRRFLKYPIEFHPSAPGDFEDTVVFRAPQLNKTFAVHLMGRGKEEKYST